MKKGRLIVLSGPSGVGKGTIRENMSFSNYIFSISSTTRQKRENEVDGVDYNFITKKEFENKIQEDKMLEYAKFIDNYYGTDKEVVLSKLEEGKNVLLEIECQGALQVLSKMEDVLSIFILPPSLEVLENRLRNRGTEDEEKVIKRLKKAEEEIGYKDRYKYLVINDNLEHATQQLEEILVKELENV